VKLEGKRPLGRLKSKWVVNIKTDDRVMELGVVYLNDLDRDKNHWRTLFNTVMNLRDP
jgi:hypothetical protein